jgi:Tfp pilus assembly protein PilF
MHSLRDNEGFPRPFMRTLSSISLLSSILLAACAGELSLAQQPIPQGGGTSTITRPDSIQDTGYFGYMANSPGGIVSGNGIYGRVVVDGNPLLWEPITVTLSCANGRTDLTTQTDAAGKFAIDHVNLPTVDTLDGDVKRQMQQHYEGCVVRAELAGYRSTVDTITQRILRDKPFLADLVLTPLENAPGTAISTTTASAPPEAQKALENAHEEWLHRNPDGAKSDLEAAVKADPQLAEGWYLLGRVQAASDLHAATESLKKAQAADPRFVLPCVWLATIAVQNRDWPGAASWTERALALDPAGTSRIWYYNGLADYRLGKNEAARTSAEKALAMDPEHTVQNAEELLALTLINKNDYAGALNHLRNTLTYIPAGPNADLIKRQIAFVEQRVTDTQK